jgi:hypothetical protein
MKNVFPINKTSKVTQMFFYANSQIYLSSDLFNDQICLTKFKVKPNLVTIYMEGTFRSPNFKKLSA